ncbi:disease resistance protein RUN1 [Trifolium repens]|nr:disease resistance protein RUN1 [Trifolium repens]
MERLKQWKVALNQAANLSGNHFSPGNDYEHNFIENIVKDVYDKINRVPLYVADYLVGLESRISKVNSLLDLKSNDGVCIIGIHGTGEHMGKEIVRRESPKEPGERSRLWSRDDIVHVLKENTGTRKIEIIHLNSPSSEAVVDWNGKAFKKMKNLKTLIIKDGHFSQGARNLPKKLRVLEWKRCPLNSLSFWFLIKKFENMVLLTVNCCKYLIDIPNVLALQNLKKFSFRNCDNLVTIHKSVGHLNKLEILDAYGCKKLESFPPLRLSCLKQLELSMCTSLKNFPKLLCKMKNIKTISLHNIPIRKLPSSFKNLSELHELSIDGCRKLKYSSKIFMMPNLKLFSAVGCSLLMEKQNEKFSSENSSSLRWDLHLRDKNLSEQSVQVVLSLWSNVSIVDLSNNNIRILPSCLNQCQIEVLTLDGCKYLEEIRGIPPNLILFSAKGCKSLTSSCIRMLLNQELHKAGCPIMTLPSKLMMIPDWFEHQIRGSSISFWFRKQIPSISCIILLLDPKPSLITFELKVKLFVNGNKHCLYIPLGLTLGFEDLPSDYTHLFDLIAYNREYYSLLMNKVGQVILKNEWIHVEVQLIHNHMEDRYLRFGNPQIGIHVFKEKETMEADNLKLENFKDSSMQARMASSSPTQIPSAGVDIAAEDQSLPAVDSLKVAAERIVTSAE